MKMLQNVRCLQQLISNDGNMQLTEIKCTKYGLGLGGILIPHFGKK